MHFKINSSKNLTLLSCVSALALMGSLNGCGLLGNKTPPIPPNKDASNGCLNQAKDLFGRYSRGEAGEAEWKKSFDCVNESLTFFTEYVRGTTPDAYTQSDMYTFVSRFIITNHDVKRDLLRGAFQLKASLLGGTSDEFKKDEIETFKRILPRIRDITADLIPYLQMQQSAGNDYDAYLEIAEGFKHAGEQLADLINSLPVGMLTENSVNLLVEQLAQSLDIEMIDGLSTKVFVAKWLLFNSRPDAVEEQDWGQIVKTSMGLGGLALAAMKAPKGDIMNDYHYRNFMWEVAKRVRPYLNDALILHGGVIPLPLIDHVVDILPAEMQIAPPQILKQTLRPILIKVLGSTSKFGVDAGVLDTVYNLGEEWIKNTELLDRFYEAAGLDREATSPVAMLTAMNQFGASLQNPEEQFRFTKMKSLLMGYKPLFYKNTIRVMYGDGVDYSKIQQFFVLSSYQAVELIHKAYGSGDDYFLIEDFQAFYKDYADILFATKTVDPTGANWGTRRFQDLDLFTPVSNGDSKAQFNEIVYYAMIIMSASDMKKKMADEIFPKCDQNLGVDILGVKWITASCFRNEFHNRIEYWLDYFPKLKSYWATLTPDQKAKALIWLEHGSRRNGYNDDNVASFDIQAMPTILHYAETMFTRFNKYGGNVLGRQEIMNAYPVFKSLLATKAPISQETLLQGIFTYIVHYREMPDTASAKGIAKLMWWLVIFKLPTTKVSTDRAGIYNIICILGMPESTSQQEATPTICKP